MQVATLDMICRRTLLERGLPIHWYSEFLFHASACIRELTRDTLKIVNAANLPINSYGAIDLPADFVDEVMLGYGGGGLLQAIPKQPLINPLRIHSTETGQFVPYNDTDVVVQNGQSSYGFVGLWDWFWNVNSWGEPTGRDFGANGGVQYGYKVIKERRQIQLIGDGLGTNIILLYISNGQSVDNATQIDWQAFSTIQSYIDWKSSVNAAIKDSPEAATYYNEKRLLRASLNDMTITDMKNILRKNYTLGLKN